MDKQQHTPGPWRVEGDEEYTHHALHHPYHDNRYIIGDIDNDDLGYMIVARMSDHPQQAANARLIAAAPELLDALQGVLDHLWDGRKRDVRRDFDLMVYEVAARKAIARATGQE